MPPAARWPGARTAGPPRSRGWPRSRRAERRPAGLRPPPGGARAMPASRPGASVRPASTAPNGSTTANSRAFRSVASANVLGTYATTLMTIATSKIWLIMSGQLRKCRATRTMAQATRATPARCSNAKASAAAALRLGPEQREQPLPGHPGVLRPGMHGRQLIGHRMQEEAPAGPEQPADHRGQALGEQGRHGQGQLVPMCAQAGPHPSRAAPLLGEVAGDAHRAHRHQRDDPHHEHQRIRDQHPRQQQPDDDRYQPAAWLKTLGAGR